MYTNYIFDLYGTLVDINTNENNPYLWKKLSLFYSYNRAPYTASELKKEYNKKVLQIQKSITNTQYPDFPVEKIFLSLYKDKNVIACDDLIISTCKLFRVLSLKYIKLYDGVIDLLNLLKANNKKMYLLSNAQEVFTLSEMKMLGIYDYFDGICFSSDFQICKPDKNFFLTLISKFNLNVSQSIMIGNDHIADIYGSSLIDLDSLYIHSNLSPKPLKEMTCKYTIMDGNVDKIKSLIIL